MEQVTKWLDLQTLTNSIVVFLPRLIIAIVILVAFWLFFRLSRRSLTAVFRRAGLDPLLTSLLVDKIYHVALGIFAVVMAAGQVGINVGAALAGIGVVGIAIGFAAQDLLSNVIAGFVIFWDKPFVVGDYIRIRDQYGCVNDITLRSTRIRTNQHTYVVIPNKHVIDEVMINHSKHGATRVDVPVGIAYKELVPEARKVLLQAVEALQNVAKEPAPSIVVEELGGSSVNLLVRVWIDDAANEMPVFYATVEAAKLALDAAGIQIPYPHLQLFWDDVEERVLRKVASVPKLVAGDRGSGAV